MAKLLNEQIEQQIRTMFAEMQHPVQILFFGRETDCETCADARQMIEEITPLSDKLSLAAYDIETDSALAGQYKVDKAPGIVLLGREGEQLLDFGVRFAGIPSGHEFSTLIHDILMVSGRDSALSPQTREILKGLTKPVLLQVFVTPTWPYCPRAVVLAHQMAMESPMVEAEMVEAMEFGDLSDQYMVSGVPHTVINEGAGNVVGAVPEEYLIAEIQRSLGRAAGA